MAKLKYCIPWNKATIVAVAKRRGWKYSSESYANLSKTFHDNRSKLSGQRKGMMFICKQLCIALCINYFLQICH